MDWLIGIARRCIDDALSGRRQEPDPPDTVASRDLEEETVNRLALWGAVGRLGERDRELIALRYGADLARGRLAASWRWPRMPWRWLCTAPSDG